jgi:hypothetical protein
VLRRDAESFARGIAQQLATQTETLKADVFLDDVMVWGPGQLEIAATQPVSVAQEMRDKNVNLLISGQLAKGPGRYWSVQPYYYVSDAVFSDRAGELLAGGELHLGSPLSYIAGNQQSIREIEQQLAARLQIVGRFWQGLTQYDLGTEDGYRQASELFCGEEARSGATLPQGSDLLFLFCGHSNQMLAGMAGRANAEFERLSAAAEAAYRAGLAIAPANARLQTSLAAVLLERGKPGVLDCAQAVEAPIVAALGQAEAVLASGKLQSNMLFTTLMEAHNLVGQAHFWLGFCFDPAAAGEHWEEAERQYRAALRLRQNPLPNLRYGLRTAADAGFLLGNLNLVRYYNSTVNPPLIEQHRIDSLAAFSDSITYNLEIGDAEATNRAVDAATSAIFLLCLSNDPDQVGTILARFEGQSISPQQVVERIENAFSPDLRKGCGL